MTSEVQKTESGKTRVVILGGGFAGVAVAMGLDAQLARRSDMEVILVSRENFTVFTPMLHEVACGDLDPSHITNPLRKLLRRVITAEAEVESIDLMNRTVTVTYGFTERRELQYDHLVLASGAETNFFGLPGVAEQAVTLKSLSDAVILRNRVIALLERANIEADAARRQPMLTFVVAGGGFAGIETIGAVNDLVRDSLSYYPRLDPAEVRIVLVHGGAVVLPELGEKLGLYTQDKLRERKVEIKLNMHVTAYTEGKVVCDDGDTIPAGTLIWTAGVTPSPAIKDLNIDKQKGRIVVSDTMEVAGNAGVWAAGDCAAITDPVTKAPYPTTAQHALREGKLLAKNILACIDGKPLRPFRYKSLGQLAAIGRRTGVARVIGINFSGFIGWALWSGVYLTKLPRFEKKVRVAFAWMLNLFFSVDLVQYITLRDVRSLSRMVEHIGDKEHAA
jgi:NADH dehydrogenase